MFSPSFECTMDGLRSAVRLRHTLLGTPDPEAATARYMRGHGISTSAPDAADVLRRRILIIIEDIEHLAACQDPECTNGAHPLSQIEAAHQVRRGPGRARRGGLTLTPPAS